MREGLHLGDVFIYRKGDESLGRKTTNKALYLNDSSHHRPTQKWGFRATLVHFHFIPFQMASPCLKSWGISEESFFKNGYSSHDINWTLTQNVETKQSESQEENRGGGGFTPLWWGLLLPKWGHWLVNTIFTPYFTLWLSFGSFSPLLKIVWVWVSQVFAVYLESAERFILLNWAVPF